MLDTAYRAVVSKACSSDFGLVKSFGIDNGELAVVSKACSSDFGVAGNSDDDLPRVAVVSKACSSDFGGGCANANIPDSYSALCERFRGASPTAHTHGRRDGRLENVTSSVFLAYNFRERLQAFCSLLAARKIKSNTRFV